MMAPSGIMVYAATNSAEVKDVMDIRWQGYKKYFDSPNDVVDSYDHQKNCTLLLAAVDGRAVGTLRLLDSCKGPIELEEFIELNKILPLPAFPIVEATRFSVPAHEMSREVKAMLWKAFYLYCLDRDSSLMLAWIRPSALPDYHGLLFTSIGLSGRFCHKRLAGKEHHTVILDVRNAAKLYGQAGHPYYRFFCVEKHPNIWISIA